MSKAVMVTIAATLVAATALVALAAPFGLASTKLAGSKAAVARCDTNGFTVSYGLSGANVNSVTVAAIADPGCEGATIQATLTNSTKTSIGVGSAVVPVDGDTLENTVVLTIAPAPPEASVSGIQLNLTGP